jgi:hypothetical protein
MLALPAPHAAAAAAAAGPGSRGGWAPPPMPGGELPSGTGPWENLWGDS